MYKKSKSWSFVHFGEKSFLHHQSSLHFRYLSVSHIDFDQDKMADNTTVFDELPDIGWIIWHSNYMLLGVLVLAPVGTFVARYYKETWTLDTFYGTPLWQIVHMTYMICTAFVLLYGITAAKVQSPSLNTDSAHGLIGWIAFGIFIVQFGAGILLQILTGTTRKLLRIVHAYTGGSLSFAMLIIAMVSGNMVAAQFPYFSSLVILCWMIFALVMHIVIAYTLHEAQKDFLSIEKDGYLKFYRTFLPFPTAKLENTPAGSNFRLVLFLWFQFGAAAAFTIIAIPYSEASTQYRCSEWKFLQAKCT